MNAGSANVVEFFPEGLFGLHWEAAGDGADGLLLAAAEGGRIAMANADNPEAVVLVEAGTLALLRDALVAGQFDHLLSVRPS